MGKRFILFILTSALVPVFVPARAQNLQDAENESIDVRQKQDEVTDFIRQISLLNSEQLDSMRRKALDEIRKPIESLPKSGGRVNGHVLDVDGNPIGYREVRICERDIVGRAITISNASAEDGFFNLTGIKSPDNSLTFEAEGYETQSFPIDRGTFEIRLLPVKSSLKPGDVIKGSVTCWQNEGGFRAGREASGAVVAEVDDNGNIISSTVVEERSFSLKITKPGNTLMVSKDGYTTVKAPILISDWVIGLDKL